MPYIGTSVQGKQLTATTNGIIHRQQLIGDGILSTFALIVTPVSINATDVYINGVYQNKTSYTVIGSAITFSEPLPNLSVAEIKISDTTFAGGAPTGIVSNQRFSGNGSTVAFTLSSVPVSVNNVDVHIDSVYQQKNTYSVSGSTLTFSTAPIAGVNNVDVSVLSTIPIGVASADFINFTPAGTLSSTNVQSAITELVTDLAASSGSSMVGYLPAGTGAVSRTVQSKLRESVSVMDFGAVGDGVTDDTDAIQAAIDYFPSSPDSILGCTLLSSNKVFRITKPIILQRGQSLIGDGTPVIIADFSSWTGNLTAIEFLNQTNDSSASIISSFSQLSYGFAVKGINNSGQITRGINFYTTAVTTQIGVVTNSYIGSIRDIYVEQFDVGIVLQECWNSTFSNVTISQCRMGVVILGKAVNILFDSLRVVNPSNSFTSSVAATYGVYVNYKTYTDGVGRPEGITFVNGLIYGCYNNVNIVSCLQITFNSVILDGASSDCVYVVDAQSLLIDNCYLYTSTSGSSCIYFAAVASSGSNATTITNNTLFGNAPTTSGYGVYFVSGGLSRNGIFISGNRMFALTIGILAAQCPNYSTFSDNFGESIQSYFIQVINAGVKTIVDGNTCSSSVPILFCHPTQTDSSLNIGTNSSVTTVTQFRGKAALIAGQTSVELPNNFWTSDNYVRPITNVSIANNPGSYYWVTNLTNQSAGTLNISSAQASNINVYYTVEAVPYTAF